MASLNLVPNAGLILAHAGVFIASSYVFNKLVLTPYLELKAKRESQTTGSFESVSKMKLECQEKFDVIENKMKSAYEVARETHADIKKTASEEKAKLVQQAKLDAKNELEELKKKISGSFKTEKEKVNQVVQSIVKETMQAVLK